MFIKQRSTSLTFPFARIAAVWPRRGQQRRLERTNEASQQQQQHLVYTMIIAAFCFITYHRFLYDALYRGPFVPQLQWTTKSKVKNYIILYAFCRGNFIKISVNADKTLLKLCTYLKKKNTCGKNAVERRRNETFERRNIRY